MFSQKPTTKTRVYSFQRLLFAFGCTTILSASAASAATLTIEASADLYEGAPNVEVYVNDSLVVSADVVAENGQGTQTFSAEIPDDALVDGSDIMIAYNNDRFRTFPNEDRNLYIHSVALDEQELNLDEAEITGGRFNAVNSDGIVQFFDNGTMTTGIPVAPEEEVAEEPETTPDASDENTETPAPDSENDNNVDISDEEPTAEDPTEDTAPTETDTPEEPTDGEAETEAEPTIAELIQQIVSSVVNSILSAIFGEDFNTSTAQATEEALNNAFPGITPPNNNPIGNSTADPNAGNTSNSTATDASFSSSSNGTIGSSTADPVAGGTSNGIIGSSTADPSAGGAPALTGSNNFNGGTSNGASSPPPSGSGAPETTNETGVLADSLTSPASNTVTSSTADPTPGSSVTANATPRPPAPSGGTPTPSSPPTQETGRVDNGEVGDGEEIDFRDVGFDQTQIDFGQINDGTFDAAACAPGQKVFDSPFDSADYCEALEKSLYFFYANRSGPAVEVDEDGNPILDANGQTIRTNPIPWRDTTDMDDGQDNGVNLFGGWYDAGDAIKFDLPGAWSATSLAWGGDRFYEAFKQSGLIVELKKHLSWINEYYSKTYFPNAAGTPEDDVLFVQVGDGSLHSFMGRPEDSTLERKSYFVANGKPATEVAAEKAASFTAFALLLQKEGDFETADFLAGTAKQLFEYAYQYQGKYSDSVQEANPYYTSKTGYDDELTWAAGWIYKATGDPYYLDIAQSKYAFSDHGLQWDSKEFGNMVLLYDITGDEKYLNDFLKNVESYKSGGRYFSVLAGTPTNPGLTAVQDWGSCPYGAGMALASAAMAKSVSERTNDTATVADLMEFASDQVDYCIGDNPQNFSYLIGFGENFPQNPHHRGSNATQGQSAAYQLTGAMVAGPRRDGSYSDSFYDWVTNEVGVTYNAPLVGALAALYEYTLGGPEGAASFPDSETVAPGGLGTGVDVTQEYAAEQAPTPFGQFEIESNPNFTGVADEFSDSPENFANFSGESGGVVLGATPGAGVGIDVDPSFATDQAIFQTRAPADIEACVAPRSNANGSVEPSYSGGLGHQTPAMGEKLNVNEVWEGATGMGIDAAGFIQSYTSNVRNFNFDHSSDKKCAGALAVLNDLTAIKMMGGIDGDPDQLELLQGSATNAAFAGNGAEIRELLASRGGNLTGVTDQQLVNVWSVNSHYYNHTILNVDTECFTTTHLRSLNDQASDGTVPGTRGGYNDKGAFRERRSYETEYFDRAKACYDAWAPYIR